MLKYCWALYCILPCVVTINCKLLFLLNTLVIVSVIFYWDACVAPVNICNSGFIMLVRHVCYFDHVARGFVD